MSRKKFLKEQAQFRKDARAAIEAYGATLFSEGAPGKGPYTKWTVHVLQCPRLNSPLAISIWCDEGDLYSVYLRTDVLTNEEANRAAAIVAPVWLDKMNPYSGKWNVHYSTPEDALNELNKRLYWLTTND